MPTPLPARRGKRGAFTRRSSSSGRWHKSPLRRKAYTNKGRSNSTPLVGCSLFTGATCARGAGTAATGVPLLRRSRAGCHEGGKVVGLGSFPFSLRALRRHSRPHTIGHVDDELAGRSLWAYRSVVCCRRDRGRKREALLSHTRSSLPQRLARVAPATRSLCWPWEDCPVGYPPHETEVVPPC